MAKKKNMRLFKVDLNDPQVQVSLLVKDAIDYRDRARRWLLEAIYALELAKRIEEKYASSIIPESDK